MSTQAAEDLPASQSGLSVPRRRWETLVRRFTLSGAVAGTLVVPLASICVAFYEGREEYSVEWVLFSIFSAAFGAIPGGFTAAALGFLLGGILDILHPTAKPAGCGASAPGPSAPGKPWRDLQARAIVGGVILGGTVGGCESFLFWSADIAALAGGLSGSITASPFLFFPGAMSVALAGGILATAVSIVIHKMLELFAWMASMVRRSPTSYRAWLSGIATTDLLVQLLLAGMSLGAVIGAVDGCCIIFRTPDAEFWLGEATAPVLIAWAAEVIAGALLGAVLAVAVGFVVQKALRLLDWMASGAARSPRSLLARLSEVAVKDMLIQSLLTGMSLGALIGAGEAFLVRLCPLGVPVPQVPLPPRIASVLTGCVGEVIFGAFQGVVAGSLAFAVLCAIRPETTSPAQGESRLRAGAFCLRTVRMGIFCAVTPIVTLEVVVMNGDDPFLALLILHCVCTVSGLLTAALGWARFPGLVSAAHGYPRPLLQAALAGGLLFGGLVAGWLIAIPFGQIHQSWWWIAILAMIWVGVSYVGFRVGDGSITLKDILRFVVLFFRARSEARERGEA